MHSAYQGIDPGNGFRLDRTKIKVVAMEDAERDAMREWLKRPMSDRFRALELLRWNAFGFDRATSRLPRLLELAQRAPR